MTNVLRIDNTDVATWGLVVERVAGWLDAPPRTRASAVVPGRAGARPLAPEQEAARQVIVRGHLVASTMAALLFNRDRLQSLAGPDSVQLQYAPRFGDRYVNARLDSLTVGEPQGPQFIALAQPVELRFTQLDPFAYDVGLTTIGPAAATTYPDCPLGTGPVRPLITVTAPGGLSLSAAHIFLVRSDASLHQSMLFGGLTLTPGQSLVVDCDARMATVNGVSVLDTLTGGDFFVLEAKAPLGNFPGSGWPKVGLANVVAGATCTTSYRKSWR